MARQVPFTEYEAVLLLDAYLRTVSGDASRRDSVKNCSEALRRIAINNGVEIEDNYRSISGITFQMASMESAYLGSTKIKPATKLFSETVSMYRNNRKKYERLLKEAMLMADGKNDGNNGEEAFMSWLSKKVSPVQLSELYIVLQDIEQQAKKAKIVKESLFENTDVIVFKKICNNIAQNKVFELTHKRQMERINSALNYLLQYAQESVSVKKVQMFAKKENKPSDKKNRETTTIITKLTEERAGIRIVDLTAISDMTYTKPVVLSYFGNETKEKSWRALYIDLCRHVIEDYPEILMQLRKDSMNRKTKLWLVDDAHTKLLITPRKVIQNYHIETNLNARDIIRSIKWLLDQCSVEYKNIVIMYIKQDDKDFDHKPATPVTERKYDRNDAEGFYQWLLNDQHIKDTSCRLYVNAIHGAEKYAVKHSLESDMLFETTAEEARKTAHALLSDAEFIEINKTQHNRYYMAITQLLAYLGENWNSPEKFSPLKNKKAVSMIDANRVNVKDFKAVLKKRFSHGYRLGSSIEIKKFRRYFEEINGYALEIESSDIEKVISQCGIEHEGRVYAPEVMLNEELRDKLFCFIDKNFDEGKKVVYYEAIFRKFSDDFLDQNIYNAEMLKAYISYMAGSRYFMSRNYLSNERLSTADPVDDVRTCLKEHGMPMKVKDLCKTLSHIPSDRIKTILGTHGEFVRNSKGEYFHADLFLVSNEELDNISALINKEIEEHAFISGNELYDSIKKKYPYVYEKNATFSMIGWRDALKYKLGNRYSFTGNIISSKNKELSMSDVFAAYGAEQKNFTLSELLAFAENMGSAIYFDALYQSVARVSKTHFVSRNDVYFQVKETDIILGRFCTGSHLPLSEIRDFGIFPEASHPWTPYLLEHYVAFHSKRYYLLHIGYNMNTVVGAIVKKENIYDSFDNLIVDVIADGEVKLQKKDVLDYLSKKGYIAKRTYSGIEELMIKAQAKRNMKEK